MKLKRFYKFIIAKKIIISLILLIVIYILYKINKSGPSYQEVNSNQYLLEEINFPIAYGISVYRDPDQFEHLFKAIYRPFNLYCIHVDKKSDISLHTLVSKLTKKYRNVILPKKFIDVVHSEYSVLESELLCMEALYQHKNIKWKYFINLTGQEWPLKTNLELVRIFKELKGANLIEKVIINPERLPSNIGLPPDGIRLWKGAVHIIAIREFIGFSLYNKRALLLLEYLKKTLVPDETYFSTLNHDHSFKAPGGYSGYLMRDPIKYPFITRYKLWETESVCHGKYVRGICIFSMADVPEMIDINNQKLFANKFIMGVNNNVFNFMEKWFYNRSKIVYSDTQINPYIDLKYYSQLTVVKNHFQF